MRAGSATNVIRTARLTLRPPCADDVAAVVRGIGNYDVTRWLGRVPFPYGDDDARDFVAMTERNPGRYWFIHDAEGLAGGISIDGELGYWLRRDVWGRGYATEAGDAAVDAHFSDRAAGPLLSGHFLDNARSARVLAKLGFAADRLRKVESVALGQAVTSQQLVLSRATWSARRNFRLVTPRLRLRELRTADARAVARLCGDPAASPDEVGRRIEAWRFRGRPGFVAAITGRRTGRVLGLAGLLAAPDAAPALDLLVDPAHRRRGIATEAAHAFLADVVDRFDLPALYAGPRQGDPATAALLRKLGFRPSGPAAPLESAPDVLYRLDRSDVKAGT